MIAMQYKILLPEDYDMEIIRSRVLENGEKTDGFQDLLWKAYLISETGRKEYSPLYLWKHHAGMNTFIFKGFYDNILASFGWQKINVGIPFILKFDEHFDCSHYVMEIEKTISPMDHMKTLEMSMKLDNCLGEVLIYNPDKWKYSEFYFFGNRPNEIENGRVYEILHLSKGK
ncbi:DUF4865 family protein [Amedibacillus sp. YH-ame10]